jgi:hypothetical protein
MIHIFNFFSLNWRMLLITLHGLYKIRTDYCVTEDLQIRFVKKYIRNVFR